MQVFNFSNIVIIVNYELVKFCVIRAIRQMRVQKNIIQKIIQLYKKIFLRFF